MNGSPALSGVVVHWRNEARLAELVAAWPRDPRFELIVVDNGSVEPLPTIPGSLLRPEQNLGFAGGANLGVAAAHAPVVLLLNPDVVPAPGALEALLVGLDEHPRAAGLAPRLTGTDGTPQWQWQLKPLPGPLRLVLEGLFLPAARGPREEPAPGTPVEQPAAAALLLRKSAWNQVGGLDTRYYPAWFEDVDLAHRLRAAGLPVLYWPAASFRHALGATVPVLGYGRFLWLYYRHLATYLARHHGAGWALLARLCVTLGLLTRWLLLPLRVPQRAASRAAAATGLLAAAAGAFTGWRTPRSWARAYQPLAPSRWPPPEGAP